MGNVKKVLFSGLLASATILSSAISINADQLEDTKYEITSNLNMRQGPSTNYISIGTIKKGSIVSPLEYSQDKLWVKIEYNNQYVWICTTYMKKVEDNISSPEIQGDYKTTERVNLRKGASIDTVVILTIPKDEKVKVVDISQDSQWARVSYNDETGWVSLKYLKKINSNTDDSDNNNSTKYEDYITTSSVNVRKGPSKDYIKLGTLNKNVIIRPLELDKYGNWAKFNFNGQDAWVCTDYLNKVTDSEGSNNTTYEKYTVLYNLNLRLGPSNSYSVIKTIPSGSAIEFIKLSSDKNWANVKYNSSTGWVSYKYIKKLDNNNNNGNNNNNNNNNNNTNLNITLYTSENINFRNGASISSNKICTIPKNTKVIVLSYNSDKSWAKVKYNDTTGWVSTNYLKSSLPQAYWTGTTTARLNLREKPNTSGKILISMPNNESIKIYEEKNGWLKVTYNNITGYCSADYVK